MMKVQMTTMMLTVKMVMMIMMIMMMTMTKRPAPHLHQTLLAALDPQAAASVLQAVVLCDKHISLTTRLA